jgi:hypothetical protein
MSLGLHLPVLGLTVVESPDGMAITVLDHGGAAERSGQVRAGDILTSITDIGIDDKNLDEITRLSTSVDHRGLTKICILRQDGRQSTVVLDVQGGFVEDAGVATDAVGVGISVAMEDGRPVVADLAAWGSARWSGKIGVGDEVVSVRAIHVAAMTPLQVVRLLEEPSAEADGGVVKVGIRRKGAASDVAPTVVLLARSLPTAATSDSSAQVDRRSAAPDAFHQKGARVSSKAEAVPDVPSISASAGADAWNPVSWLGQARTLLGEKSVPQSKLKSKPDRVEQASSEPMNASPARDSNQSAVLTATLEELLTSLSTLKQGERRLENRPALEQAAKLPECTYDVALVLKLDEAIQDAFRVENQELQNAQHIISLSQENMDKRKQHIIQLAAQLKATEEKHHKDLRSNNEWMQHEIKKEKEALQVRKSK